MVKKISTLVLSLLVCLGSFAQISNGARKAYERAIDAYLEKDFETAHSELNKAENKSPNYALVHFLRAQMLQELGRDGLALESLKKGLEIDDSEYPKGWFQLAELCWGEGLYDDGKRAIESFKLSKAYDRFVADTTLQKHYVLSLIHI